MSDFDLLPAVGDDWTTTAKLLPKMTEALPAIFDPIDQHAIANFSIAELGQSWAPQP